ncbi:nucleoside/nucleotide kinase family protein [Phytohabitans houttuyneae]|uniref:Nucleoside/nucleotide kinase family protein n=1 Tax=Phytohabitans houttuyneae TaxID=1076126 RepID=A0A6V8K3V6_9ACTN|nr:nucleoside/nucleotide kinase family protein [Phytohabitans houttuyneae]GFJ77071.1 nucleoside/nucleotide kinase family protein [Phytohabitans houttuyneae]
MLDDLVARAAALAGARPGGERAILGIAGCPAAGKSTLAELLVGGLAAAGVAAALVPMDGFHLADVALERLGRRARKGAIDTFDGDGYLALLRRLRTDRRRTVWAPGFARDLEQPIAGAIGVDPDARIVVTEGNYLLADATPWPDVRAELTETWFVELDEPTRRERLIARHVHFGKLPDEAASWVSTVDDPNAALVAATRGRADLLVDMTLLEASPSRHQG